MSAILAQQTRQIGIMKAIGARNGQIAGLYLVLVFAYAVLALCVALPLSALGAYGFAQFTAGLANFDIDDLLDPARGHRARGRRSGSVVPLLAALVPIARGVRITVREALASTGIADRFGHGRFDRLLRDIRGLPRPTLLSIRNTFRRKGRLVLTLAALSLGGAIFMSVFAVRASLVKTLDDTLAYFAYDVQVELATTERTSVLVDEAMAVPGVMAAEPWRFASTGIVNDGVEGRSVVAFGLPPNAQTVRPTIQEGRWLLPDDGNAIVATANVRDDEPDLAVGDTMTLRIDGKDTTWTLVGIVQSPTRRPFLYAPDVALERATSEVGRAGVLMVVGQPGMDAAAQDALATSVRSASRGPGSRSPRRRRRARSARRRSCCSTCWCCSCRRWRCCSASSAASGLTGTMTINVVERSREIGVLRAVGASDRSVLLIFLAEGMLIGALSWALGVLASLPISKLLSDALGNVFVSRPLSWAYSDRGHGRVGRDRARPRHRRQPAPRLAGQPARGARDPGLRMRSSRPMREPDRR